jgi:hypothetical protein
MTLYNRAFQQGMNTFAEDFTRALEECANKVSVEFPVLTNWSPAKIAPPEIHLALGMKINVPIEAISYQLKRNETYKQIMEMLGIGVSETVLRNILLVSKDHEKIQVWLFARWWFSTYCEYVMNPSTLRSQFYKEDHDRFLSLLRNMLEMQPSSRIDFKTALAAWYPDSDLLKTEDQSDDDDESDEDAPPPVAAVESRSVVAPSAVDLRTPLVANRLVLKGRGDPAARSKTRRNRCNSNPTPASGNRD